MKTRTIGWFGDASLSIALALMQLLIATGSGSANPIAPSFLASDSDGNLYNVFIIRQQSTGATSWFPMFACRLPTYGVAGATEIELDMSTGVGVVQGGDGSFFDQMFNYPSCGALSGQVPNGASFNGLEYVNGVLYGVGSEGCGFPSTFRILDPTTGASVVIGPTHVGPISGLSWDDTNGKMYGVTGCSSQGPSMLVVINMNNGAATPVGSTGIRGLGSLEFASHELFAGGDATDGGHLYEIDPSTGAATLMPGNATIGP